MIASLQTSDNDVQKLFDYVLENQCTTFHEFEKTKNLRELAKNFQYNFSTSHSQDTNNEIKTYKDNIQSFDFYDLNNYTIYDKENMFNLMDILNTFKQAIITHIEVNIETDENGNTKSPYILKRQVAP